MPGAHNVYYILNINYTIFPLVMISYHIRFLCIEIHHTSKQNAAKFPNLYASNISVFQKTVDTSASNKITWPTCHQIVQYDLSMLWLLRNVNNIP